MQKKGLKFIFVGAAGNIPNRQSIKTFINVFWPEICKKYQHSTLNIIGKDWNKYINSVDNIHLTGFLTDDQLLTFYRDADFSIGYLDYGAGVKGKVLESMENSTVVLGNSVAFEGIECPALIPFAKSKELIDQIEFFLNELNYIETVNLYKDFLTKHYSKKLIKDGVMSFLQKEVKIVKYVYGFNL